MSLTAEFSVPELTEMMSRFSSIEEMLKFVTEFKQLQEENSKLKEQVMVLSHTLLTYIYKPT